MDPRRKPLADFIKRKTSQARFAREALVSESHLSLILKGEKNASLRLARRIVAASDNVIPMEVLMEKESAGA
jgi:transcriptional regulator with XRE-family HTH domain